MPRTVLYEKLSSAGARMGEYAGAETALAFGEPHVEFDALRSGCAVYDLGWRARIEARGEDRSRWLNGMVTNNIRDLALNHGLYNFLLNAQGHILGDMYVYNRGEYLLVGTEMSQTRRILETFDHYIIMDDVELADVSEKQTALAVQGPKSKGVLQKAGIDVPDVEPMVVADITWQGVKLAITRMASPQFITYELWVEPRHAEKLWDALAAAGATPAGTEALEMFRIAAGIPMYSRDIRDRDLPQETGQQHALNFSKGCYLGQEIVERIRSRGAVHRIFSGFLIAGPPPAPGSKVQAGGKDVGEITSVASVPVNGGSRTVALGYIRREAGKPGSEVQVGEASASVEKPPFKEVFQ